MPEEPVKRQKTLAWDRSWSGVDGFELSCSPDVTAWSDVRYVLLDQHGGREPLPDASRGIEATIDQELVEKERDAGMEYLIPSILCTVPGGLAVHATVSRVYCDLNRRSMRKPTPRPDARYFLHTLEMHTPHGPEHARRLHDRAKRYYDRFRGEWQAGPGIGRPTGPGLLERLHGKLRLQVLFWDLHTLDRYGVEGSQRALFQAFSRCEDDGADPRRELIPRAVCEMIGEVVRSDPALGTLLEERFALGDLFRIDDPYFMYEGCTAEQIARHRDIIITEVRKDLATDEGGPGLEAARSVSVRTLERVLERLHRAGSPLS